MHSNQAYNFCSDKIFIKTFNSLCSYFFTKVAVYQEKLKELEERQSELITENMDLKELCLYLDQERLRITGDRDEGDGSSNGTITGPENGLGSPPVVETNGSITPTPGSSNGNYPTSEIQMWLLKREHNEYFSLNKKLFSFACM